MPRAAQAFLPPLFRRPGPRAPGFRAVSRRLPVVLAAAVLWCSGAAGAALPQPKAAGARDRCPVCGMFVAKYPDFAAQLVTGGGEVLHFDGVKDLMKRYLGTAGGKATPDARAVWVKDYYSLRWIDGRGAFFVEGGDVYGPMGRELVPLETEAAAREFLKDHKGVRVLKFEEITPEVLKRLE